MFFFQCLLTHFLFRGKRELASVFRRRLSTSVAAGPGSSNGNGVFFAFANDDDDSPIFGRLAESS